MRSNAETYFGSLTNKDVTAALLFILSMIVIKFIIRTLRRDPHLVKFAATLPGPPALPVIGNGYDFLINGTNNIPKILKQYGQKYGPTYRLWLGNRLLVGLANVEDLQVAFNHPNTTNKSAVLEPYTNFFDNSIFSMKSETWKRSRKILQPIFSKQIVKTKISKVNDVVKKYINIMDKHVDGPEFNLLDYLPHLATDSFTRSMFDTEVDWKTKNFYKLQNILHFADEMIIPRIFMPIIRIRWVGDMLFDKKIQTEKSKLKNFVKEIIAENKEIVDEKNENGYESEGANLSHRSFTSAVNKILKLLNKRTSIHSEINDISTLTMVTTHTTSATNSAFLVAIAAYPKIQEKLYNEIHNVFGDDDRPATCEDLVQLPYLEQCIKETQRRFTVVPCLFRNVEADTEIGSMVIPKGAQLMLRAADVHFDPKWYPNPSEFNPENFSPTAITNRPKYTLLAFSAGVRDCIGKHYAEFGMKLTLLELVRNFKFHTSMRLADIDSAASLTSNVAEYKVRIERRNRRPAGNANA